MSANRPIRIIKREQRELLADQREPEGESKTDRQISRDIFKTITSWIEDQKETKRELYRRHGLFSESSTEMAGG